MKKQFVVIAAALFILALAAGCQKKTQETQPQTLSEEEQQKIGESLAGEVQKITESLAGNSFESYPVSTPGNLPKAAGEASAVIAADIPSEASLIGNFTGDMELAGSWQDEVSKKATMDIQAEAEGKCFVQISWANSASETAEWTIFGSYDPVSGMLSYTDGAYAIYTWDAQGNGSVSGEETTEGALLKEGDKLRWQDSKLEKDAVFVRTN